MARLAAAICAAAVLAAALLVGADAFKEQDFKKCATNNFCARNRGRAGTRYAVLPGSLALVDGGRALRAALQDRDSAADGATFNLTLRAYKGPMVRLVVDEFPVPPEPQATAAAAAEGKKPAGEKEENEGAAAAEGADADAESAASAPPPAVLPPAERRRWARYQLPDILEPGLETPEAQASWSSVAETKHTWTGVIAADGAGGAEAAVRLTFDPFKVELFVGGGEGEGGGNGAAAAAPTTTTITTTTDFAPSAVINARGMFHVERTRREGKRDGDAEGLWEESFNGHADSKPRGPQALSLDLSFPGAAHAYGLPERATGLALRPTAAASPLGRPAAGSAYSEPYRLYNLDVFEYLDDSPFGLYGSIPYLVAHRAEAAEAGSGKRGAGGANGGAPSSSSSRRRPSTTVGAAWINAAEQYVDLSSSKEGTSVQWIAESGVLDLFLLAGPSPERVSTQLAAVAGTTAMPQYFSLGYHQCRWNYKDEADVTAVDAGFDEHAIPYDVLWLDIEHTDGKRYMTWDASVFPTPERMQRDVASRGDRKMVTIVDPHVKRDPSYRVHKEATELGYYVRNSQGGEFDGWCWPGSSSYLDVTSPAVREWWARQFSPALYKGSTRSLYIWNDMNEPSVFNGPEVTMGKDVLHNGGETEHRDVHNAFGYYYHLATADGLALRGDETEEKQEGGGAAPATATTAERAGGDGDRPFVLSRAFFFGTQRVGPIWTGDNAAQWSHLKVATPMLLTLGLSGLPFSGADVGGFFGNPDAELLTRFYQAGAYYPFFRGHAHLETQRREPWLFGEPTTGRVREAVRGRYALLPYFYTLFRHANVSGAPILRPLWYDFPEQSGLYAAEDAFMLGPAMLVRPVTASGAASADVTLPGGGGGARGGAGGGGARTAAAAAAATLWYCARTGAEASSLPGARYVSTPATPSTTDPSQPRTLRLPVDMESIPAFYRSGRVAARRERPRRSTGAARRDPLTLVVAVDPATGSAEGDLYLDDGSSLAFARRGHYAHRRFVFEGGVLSNGPAPAPSPPAGARPVPPADPSWAGADGLRVERVVLLLPTAEAAARAAGARPVLLAGGGGGAAAAAAEKELPPVEAGGAPDLRALSSPSAAAKGKGKGPAAGANVATVRLAGKAALPVASNWSLRILAPPAAGGVAQV